MNPLPLSFFMLAPSPSAPLKGKGNKREPFPFSLRNRQAKACWQAIPESHKAEVATKNKGKNFSWRRFVSPEALTIINESQKNF